MSTLGYKVERKVYRLRFESADMAGLVVRARSVPLGQFLDLAGMAGSPADGKLSAESVKDALGLFEGFASALVDWNVEDDDGPVPATLDGIRSLDIDFGLAVVMAWLEAIADVSPPLGSSSNVGERFPEASLPMEPLLPSRAS